MEFVVFSDVHLHNYKTGTNRVDNCINAIRNVLNFCLDNKIDFCLFCGDMFHNPKLLPTECVSALSSLLTCSLYNNIKIYAIQGNHDFASIHRFGNVPKSSCDFLNNNYSEFRLLSETNNVVHFTNTSIYGIPYYDYKEDFYNHIKSLIVESERYNILMIHQTPNKTDNIEFQFGYDFEVDDNIFDKFDLILCGHIHKRDKYKDKFFLVGNLLPNNFSDNQRSGFMWFKLNTEKKIFSYKYIDFDMPTYQNNIIDIVATTVEDLINDDNLDYTDKDTLVDSYLNLIGVNDVKYNEIGKQYI